MNNLIRIGCEILVGVGMMPHYIILGNYTEQAFRSVKDSIKRDEEVRHMIEKSGGKMQLYYTMGEYDFVAVIEMPSDENMLKFLLQVDSAGNVRTKTLKAWTETETHKLLSELT
jgi:uncharacterized protein with GYD domain